MDQKIPLDRDSFEQIVATASILQQLQKRAEYLKTSGHDGVGDLTNLIEAQQEIQTGTLSPEAALLRIVSLGLKLIPARGAGVWLFIGNAFVYRAGAGIASDDEELRALVLSRLQVNKSSNHSPNPESGECVPYKSFVVAPVFQGPKIAGALAVFSGIPNAFTEHHVATTRLLAGLAADAVDKAASAQFRHIISLERAVVLKVIESMVPPLSGLLEIKEHSFPGSESKLLFATEEENGPGRRLDRLELENVMSMENLALLQAEIDKFDDKNLAHTGLQAEVLGGLAGAGAETVDTNTVRDPAEVFVPEDVQDKEVEAVLVSRIHEPSAITVHEAATAAAARSVQNLTGKIKSFFHLRDASVFWGRGRHAVRDLFVSSIPQLQGRVRRVIGAAAARPNAKIATRAVLMIALFAGLILAIRLGAPKIQIKTPAETTTPAESNAPSNQGSARPVSHKRITDADVANALHELSRFEIPGLRRRAQYGDASSAFILGMAYETGYGVRQDCVRAARWVSEAAESGNAAAEYNLALRYRDGDGVVQNIEKSEYWTRKAVAEKYPEAKPGG